MTQKLTKNQELAMLDLEIAALKLEVLTQTEIAKNNKDAYDKIRVMYDDKCHELLKLKGEHAELYSNYEIKEGALDKSVEYGMLLTKQKLELESKNTELSNELSAVEGKLIQAQSEVTKLTKDLDNALSSFVESEGKKNRFMDFTEHLDKELSIVMKDLESKSETVAELNTELKSIPNWIRWIFKYVF